MPTVSTRILALGAALSFVLFHSIPAAAAPSCGDGVVDSNEECDGGGGLFIDGDPDKDPCSGGSRCYFRFTCCKFNCQYVGTPGAPCQDGNSCTGPDTCDQVGNCVGGPNAANDTPCDDGLYCTGQETCVDGECVSADPPCAGTACNICQEESRSCYTPIGAPCSSGDVCVTGGTCDGAGNCIGGVFNEGPCDDGLYCNGADTCSGGVCSAHSGDPCGGPDDDANCSESCDETTDTCIADDPDDSPCTDGLFCNGPDDTCQAGVCTGTGVAGCDDGNSCTTDFCDEGTDSCSRLTIGDGLPCDDRDPCTLDDVCSAGACVGSTPMLEDFCPWTLIQREHPRRDQIKAYYHVDVVGDVCGGSLKLDGRVNVTSDLVSDEAEGDDQLSLASDVTVGDDIVSAGGGAAANPSLAHLPYLAEDVVALPPGIITAKMGASGTYDLSGTHPLVERCHAARTSFETYTAMLDELPSTQAIAPIRLGPNGTATITPGVVGGLNVIDVDGSIKIGDDASVTIDGGGSPDTVVVLRLRGRLRMFVLSSLLLENGLLPENTLIYVQGRKCLMNTLAIGAGTVLCSPGRVVARQNVAWVGAVFGDGRRMLLRQASAFTYAPFQGF